MENNKSQVIIIGAGVIGICTAYYLQKFGIGVTVLEQNEISSGASSGNAGLIVPSHSIPLSSPDALKMGLKSIFEKQSPLYIQPKFDLKLFRWLFNFVKNCNAKNIKKVTRTCIDFSVASSNEYSKLIDQENLNCNFVKNGTLSLFSSTDMFDQYIKKYKLLEENGISVKKMSTEEICDNYPQVKSNIAGGLLFKDDGHINPQKFVKELSKIVTSNGGKIIENTKVTGFEIQSNKILKIQTNFEDFTADHIVIAAGAWSPLLSEIIGDDLPIQPAKGYSITIPQDENKINIPMMLVEAKIGANPLSDKYFRLAGTLELSGFNFSINKKRIQKIIDSGQDFLQKENFKYISEAKIWYGFRPLTPDGLPIIEKSSKVKNLTFASGHGTLGMTLGPITGLTVAEIITENPTTMNTKPFSLNRFN